jgi:hypothetical protein
MNKRTVPHEALLTIAVAGLLSGALGSSCAKSTSDAPAAAAKQDANPAALGLAKHACKAMNECKGQGGCKAGDAGCAGKNTCKGKGGCATVDKHSCAGKNTCKGLGGCSMGDNGCPGKNSCKGKGGCSVPVMH